ncbi:hypothetical protein E4K66_13650 [Bradyrhizobium frederickii]|uniref:Uncharacterized protein n=1 Tax=Bradyrhizobium frederickii TaxID=2560054 RepID=A0A4Y9L787_9BRAD|nr:hypothetical protein E4K66_13650 [Bradyrhizobium frederickii]
MSSAGIRSRSRCSRSRIAATGPLRYHLRWGGWCWRLKRDAIRINRHRALGCCLSMIFPENRCALFRIML